MRGPFRFARAAPGGVLCGFAEVGQRTGYAVPGVLEAEAVRSRKCDSGPDLCHTLLQLDAGGDDAVVADGFAGDGVAGFDAGQKRAFGRAFDDHLARAGSDGGP